jgi:hypothetical protein
MYCKNCGAPINQAGRFCMQCGTAIGAAQPQSNVTQSVSNSNPYSSASHSQGATAAQPAMQPSFVVQNSYVQRPTVMLMPTKSVGVALLLAFFFGPLGMLYSTIVGGLIMLVITPVIGIFTLGLGLLITHPICVIWAAVAANMHNDRLYRQAQMS